MKENLFKARLRFLLCLTLFVALCFNVNMLHAQITVATTVPTGQSEALNVGVGTATFSVTITNTASTVTHITSVAVNQPAGVSLFSAIASIGTASINNNSIILNVDIPAYQTLTVQYIKKASCSAVPNATTDFTVNVTDIVTITSSKGTFSTTTNSYPIIFPGLKVETDVATHKAVEWQKHATDIVKVTNVEGAGKVDSMMFTMEWADAGAISIDNFQLVGPTGTLTISSFSNSATKASFTITSTQLQAIGFTDGILDPKESFIVNPSFKVLKYNANLHTNYSVDYIADGITCNRLPNATSEMYYTQLYPNPQAVMTNTNITLANLCSQNFEADYIIQDTSSNIPSNFLLNCYLSFGLSNCIVKSVSIGSDTLINTNDRWYIPATNLDGDALVSDIAPGQIYTVHVVAQPTLASVMSGLYPKFGVYLNGTKINDDEVSLSVYNGDLLYNTHSSVSGPTDKIEGQSATYTYSINAESQNFTSDVTQSFLNVTQAKIICDATGDIQYTYPDKWGVFNDSKDFTLTTTCNMSQTFRMVLQTVGCSLNESTITSATGNTIIQCNGSGGDCYTLTTDTVSIDKATTMNTCTSFALTAPGHLSHNYGKSTSSSCPKYNYLIARVYDQAGLVQCNDNGVTVNINGSVLTMQNDPTHAMLNGRAWKVDVRGSTFSYKTTQLNTENIQLNANLTIKGNHNLPDLSNVNLRVQFALIDEKGILCDGGWSKGIALTVYDPEPKFGTDISTFSACGGFIVSATTTAGAYNWATPVTIKSIEYPAIENCYYSTVTRQTNTTTIDNTQKNATATASANYTQPFYAICVDDDSDINITPPLVITYTDYYNGCTTSNFTNSVNYTSSHASMPSLVFHPDTIQQSIASTTTWKLKIENTGSGVAQNVMLKIEPDKDNKVRLRINQLAINGVILTKQQYSTVNDTTIYINIGSLSFYSQTEIEISANYTSCMNSGISKLNIKGAWSCETLTGNDLVTNFETFYCGTNTVLQLQNMIAVLNPVETFPTNNTAYNLCTDIPISVDLNNIGRADLTQLGIWFTSKNTNMTITGNKINWVFNGKSGNIIHNLTSIPNIDLKSQNNIISEYVLSPITKANSFAPLHGTDPIIHLDFKVQAHCGTISPLTFEMRGITNCGDEQIKLFSYRPHIKGLEYVDSISVSAPKTLAFPTYQGSTNFHASVTNTSKKTIDTAYIQVVLPKGVTLVSYVSDKVGAIVSNTQTTDATTGAITIEFELAKGIHLAVGETVGLTCYIKDNATCPPLSSTIDVMGALKRFLTDCNGVKCQVVQSTDASSITLTRPQAPFTPVITGTPAVCINDNANYLVNGDDIGTVIWSVSPVTESISGNGTSATANYKEAGSKTVTADVTSASCPAKKATLSTTTTVNDKPAIPVITPLPVTLNKNSSPFELTIAPEEGIVVFSGRGVIGNMLYPDSLLCDTDNTIMCGVTNGCGTSSGSINARVACCAIKIHGQDTVCAKDTLIKHGYNVTGTEISDSVTWTLNKYLKKVLTPKADSAYLQLTSGTIDSVTLYASVSAQCKDSINIFSAPIPIFVFNGPKVDTICVLSGIGLNFSVYKSTWPVTIQYFDGNGNLLPDQENGAVTVYGSPNTNIYTVHAFDGHCFDTTFTTTVYRHQAPDAWFETTQSCVGDTIEMKIYARDLNNCGYNWFRFFLNYDSTAMQYVNFSMKNSITPNSSWVTINGKGGQLQAYIMSYLGGAFTITSSASLLTTLKFIAKKAGNNVNISLDSLTFCGLPKFNLYDSTITIGKATVATGDITGKDTLCWNTQDEVYSIAPGNDLPSRWKLSPSNAGTIQSNGRSASYTTAVGFGGTVDLQAVYDATTCSPTITLHKSITVFSRPAVLNYNVDTEWQCPETVGDGYIGYYIDPDSLINYTVWNANHTIVSNSQFFDYAPSTVPNQVDKYTFEISHRYCTLPTIYDSIYLARYPLPMASASAQPVCQSDTLRVVVSLADIHNCEYQDVNFSAFFDEANYRFAAVSLEGSLLNNNWYNHISTTTTHFVGGENIQIHFNNLSMSVPVTPGTFATLLFVPLKTGTTTIHINDVVYNSAETLTNAVAQIDVPVTVYPNPVISIADGSICQGSTFTLAPVVTGGTMPYSYIWSNASLQSSIPVSSAGNYRITVSDSHGCKANTSAHVAVLPSPTVTTQTGQSTICRGTSATISVTGAASYTWSNGSTKTLITITPSVSTTYTVTGTNASGCSNTATATLTVNPVPTVTVTGGALNGGSYTLTATATGNSPLGYKWSNTSTNSNTDAVTLPGTYTVTVNDANGCQSSASGTVTIFRSITDVCSYQPGVNLNAGNFATYQWSGPSLSANTTWNPVWVATSGTYTVVTTDANGKTYTATTTVVIHPTYSPTVTANVNGTVTTIGNGGTITTCPGIPVTLNANAGEVQYLWNNGTSQNATYTTGTVGNITLSEIDQYGCTSTTVYMNLQNYNVPQAVITQSDIITGSNNVSFTINDGNFTSFVWSTGATTRSITINSPGTYSVTATTANGCQSVTTITEALNTVPLSIIKQTATTGITLVAQSLYSDYRWYNVNTSSAIGGGGTITVTNAGTYRVDEYYNGIKVATATVVVALDASTGKLKSDVISEEDNTTPSVGSSIVSPTLAEVTNTVTVIPQPAKNEVRVVSTSPVKMVTMYDMNGKVVISTKSITVIDISILPSGTYQMVIETEAGIFNRTVVVMK